MAERKVLDVEAILREMRASKDEVILEMLLEGEDPLINEENDNRVMVEDLVEELEEKHDISFNI